uniref:PyrG3 n=1 Tax=Streptomyces rugosporus TaxID=295838 RepID=K7QRK2_STRRG|nr:PyrG3 [Streptomyces rugosporus]
MDELWLRRFRPRAEGAAHLVCFPHAGGSATYYQPMSKRLPPEFDLLAVQYPGRQDRRREPFVRDLVSLADRISEVLAEIEGPLVFFGHSMGAVVAYETARRLAPDKLFASGRRAPSLRMHTAIHQRDDAGLVAEMRKVGGTDGRLFADRELLESVLPVVRNDYRAVETYVWPPGPPLDCPVTVVVGDADPQTTIDDAAAWRAHTSGPFDLHIMSGGHFYLDHHLDEVIKLISLAR